jgi:hypothetical protein
MPGETGYGLVNIAQYGVNWFLVLNYARWWLDSIGRPFSSISGGQKNESGAMFASSVRILERRA